MSKKSKTREKRPLQVLFLPTDDGGCGWYRIRQFNDAFQLRDDGTSYRDWERANRGPGGAY